MTAKQKKQAVSDLGIAGPGGVRINTMPPSFDFLRAIQIWQGAPKVGKTSTAAALRQVSKDYDLGIDPFFCLFEGGSMGVEVQGTCKPCVCGGKKDCPECKGAGVVRHVLSSLDEIHTWFDWYASSSFNPIVIDTGDGFYSAIQDAVCAKLGISNPSDAPHGAAWTDISNTIRECISTLVNSGKGLIFLMHIYYMERRVKGSETPREVALFNIAGKSRQFIAGLANQILHFTVEPKDVDHDMYKIVCRPTADIEAGDQWGVYPAELDRGNSAYEGAKAVLSPFVTFE